MKNDKKLTILIPTYNQADKITIGLDSIPADDRIEIIVINDGSTDNTSEVVRNYIGNHIDKNILLLGWEENKGVSYALNTGYDNAHGEYIVVLGSDGDYFLPDTIRMALDLWLKDYDLIYFDVIDNTGHIRHLSPKTVNKYVGSTKFMRKTFIDNIRCPLDRKRAEDVIFNKKLQAKNPKQFFLNKVVKHYNFPREGSLTWNARHGITDKFGNIIKKGE